MDEYPRHAERTSDASTNCQHCSEFLDTGKQDSMRPEAAMARAKRQRRRTSFWSWKVTPFGVCIIFLLLGVAAMIFGPCFIGARTTSAPIACIDNLRQIEDAKEQWALDKNKLSKYEDEKVDGDPVDEAEVDKYIRKGRPKCPEGGTYTYGRVGEDPTCSLGLNMSHGL